MNTTSGKKWIFYDSHLKPSHQLKYCADLIDNISDAPIFVLEDKDRDTRRNVRHALI